MDLEEEGACDVCEKEEVGEKERERERNKGGKGRENEEGERDERRKGVKRGAK